MQPCVSTPPTAVALTLRRRTRAHTVPLQGAIVKSYVWRSSARCGYNIGRTPADTALIASRGALSSLSLVRLVAPAKSARTDGRQTATAATAAAVRYYARLVGRPRRDLPQKRGQAPDRDSGGLQGPFSPPSPPLVRRAASTHVTSRTYARHGRRDGRRTTANNNDGTARYPVCQRPGQWIRSLRSKTGCIKRGGRLRRLPVVLLRRPHRGRTVHGGAGVAPASLRSQPFAL